MAKALEETSTYLTHQIVSADGNEVFHSEWDNLNKIHTNITGSNVVNSAADIILQEVKSDNRSNSSERALQKRVPTAKRNKERSLNVDALSIPVPVTIYKRVEPSFPEKTLLPPTADNDFEFKKCMKEYDIRTSAGNKNY